MNITHRKCMWPWTKPACLIQPVNQGVKVTFRVYYLRRRTFSQLMKGTDGEHKSKNRWFLGKYIIINAVDNIADSKEELQISVMNGVWRKICPECVHDFQDFVQPETIPELF